MYIYFVQHRLSNDFMRVLNNQKRNIIMQSYLNLFTTVIGGLHRAPTHIHALSTASTSSCCCFFVAPSPRCAGNGNALLGYIIAALTVTTPNQTLHIVIDYFFLHSHDSFANIYADFWQSGLRHADAGGPGRACLPVDLRDWKPDRRLLHPAQHSPHGSRTCRECQQVGWSARGLFEAGIRSVILSSIPPAMCVCVCNWAAGFKVYDHGCNGEGNTGL